ncbi:hypothetical protein A3D07_04210 [Candidatus Curtissbacteria bacterium RIFCSPHIGHO2_02_FULL_42_15]|uniref:TVP38/TMEM64 family membrane protein n=1 Tax=Candidatus Curtissbacteria bacterium RIFCSPHIGHO2_02_FULL_42_15 TaxID=1797716 RepID=A0A1F5GEF4_9BACT|nr:MAG: hypothetical protein A3D07_04210 [Candidatus Curtissbacteria bacterium RIFCSPHIGHO2_02_FULL_42_15]
MEQEEYRIRKRKLLKHFLVILTSVAIAIYIQTSFVADVLVSYFSSIFFIPAAFLVGFLFSITFTAAISTSVFILLAETTHNPFLIALIGGFGSLAANSIVYKFFKEEIIDDIQFIEKRYARRIAHKIIHSKTVIGLTPYVAALLLASPLPDELGILMLAGANFKYTRFFLYSFAFHTIGILIIILVGSALI